MICQFWYSAQNICWYEKVTDKIYTSWHFKLWIKLLSEQTEQKRNKSRQLRRVLRTSAGERRLEIRPWTDWTERVCAGDEGMMILNSYEVILTLLITHLPGWVCQNISSLLRTYQIKVDWRRQRTLQQDTEAHWICCFTPLCTLPSLCLIICMQEEVSFSVK